MSSELSRFLDFTLQDELFAVELEKVREVIPFPDFTPVPGAPPSFLGLTSIREEVIPLFDLRIKLGFTPTLTHETAVIICEVNKRTAGLVVDAIENVISAEVSSIMATSAGADGVNADCVPRVISNGTRLRLILDVTKVLSSADTQILKKNLPPTIKKVA